MHLVVVGGQEDLLANSKHFGRGNCGGADSNTVDTLGNFSCQALICMRLPGLGVGRVWVHGGLVFGYWNCFWRTDWCGSLCCLFCNLGPAGLNAG